ncbi:MAG: hypothetical protein WCG27_09710, partial [Pseudomonadota bacterium]
RVSNEMRVHPSLKMSLLKTYLALIEGDQYELQQATDLSCLKFDGFGCWMQISTNTWPDLSALIKEEETATIKVPQSDKEDIAIFRHQSEDGPLIEDLLIDQAEIEELDTKTINYTAEGN